MTRRLVVSLVLTALAACGGSVVAGPPVASVQLPAASAVPPPPAPSAGSPCTPGRKLECTGPASAVICRAGAIATVVCRGHAGCQGHGGTSRCDDSIGDVGDSCQEPPSAENYACTPDQAREVHCTGGAHALWRTCDGPKGCTTDGNAVNCDDSLGRIGVRCAPAEGDENYACTVDGTTEIMCGKDTRAFDVVRPCRGPKHCWIGGDAVHCDQSVAREGEPCRPVDNHACSEDGRSEVKCSTLGVWTRQRACRKSGCQVRDGAVLCD